MHNLASRMPTITISLRSFFFHFLLPILSSWSTLKTRAFVVLLTCSHGNVSFCSTILPDTSRKSRQKTRAVGKTTNPVFNHTMVYDGFRPEDLTEACVELTVWDHYKLTNQFLGGLRIGFGTGNGLHFKFSMSLMLLETLEVGWFASS